LSGWKDWQIGEVVEAAEFQTFLQDQVVQVYADSSARGSALGTAVAEGMASYVKDTDSFEVYDGTGWVPVSVDAAWVTAGTAGEILISNGTADPSWVEAETTLAAGSAGELVVSAGTAGVVYEAAEATLTAGTSGFTALSSGTAGISYQPVSHNYIINGAFDVWQRGTSFDGASFPYTADRWRAGNNADATFSQQTTSLDDFQYALRFQRDSGATSTTVVQVRNIFETVNSIPLAGKTVTLSVYARAGADFSGTGMLLTIQTGTGVDQNPYSGLTGAVNNGLTTPAITTDWVRYTTTATLPTNATQIAVGIQYTPSGTAGANDWFEITGVQLEAGSVATPFKRHAPSLQGELAACQRYFVNMAGQTNHPDGFGWTASTTNLRAHIPLPVTMRANPSFTGVVNIRSEGASIAPNTVTVISVASPTGIQMNLDRDSATYTANYPAIINFGANSTFSAEL
jgi:hypothetical protein